MKAAVVGAGIMGQLLALALIKAGHQVSVFDNRNKAEMNCSMAAAGMLSPISELEKSPLLIYELGQEALLQHWPAIMADLDTPIYFQRSGSLLLAHPQDKAELVRMIDLISHQFQFKFKSKDDFYQKLNQEEITKLEPELTKFDEGYYLPDEAQLDNQAILAALTAHLIKHDVAWHQVTVDALLPGEIHIGSETKKFDMIFDCRGLGAKSTFSDLQAVRGELVWLHAPDVTINRPIRFQHPRYGLYIVPRQNHCYLIGASEIHSDNNDNISVRTTLELLTAAFYLHPGFAEARILKMVTQCRPTFPDYLPKIKYADGLVAVNGLYRHGFLLAPTLAEEIMRWLTQGVAALRYSQMGVFI